MTDESLAINYQLSTINYQQRTVSKLRVKLPFSSIFLPHIWNTFTVKVNY